MGVLLVSEVFVICLGICLVMSIRVYGTRTRPARHTRAPRKWRYIKTLLLRGMSDVLTFCRLQQVVA
jgi:hypothetical protein